jgi:proteasome accessory factor B
MNLTTLLLETRTPLTLERIAFELAQHYGDEQSEAQRTLFERDKRALRDAGVPIRQTVLAGADAGKSAYWIDRSEYELGDLGLDPDEREALLLALMTLRLEQPGQDEAALKLAVREAGRSASNRAVTAVVAPHPAVEQLHSAVTERREVAFDYRGRRRRLHPFGLLSRNGYWYVVGHDVDAGDQRTFRLDRLDSEVALGKPAAFERPPGFRVSEAFPADARRIGESTTSGSPGGDHATSAVVRVDPHVAGVVLAELGETAVVRREDDGHVHFRVPCSNQDAFRAWLFGFLEHAEVLEPPDVRGHVVDWLRAIVGDEVTQ